MKCPKCQRENTLQRAENNSVVCAACGSRFPLKTPVQPAAKPPKTPSAANVDDALLGALLSGVKHVDNAPAPPQNAETTYPLHSKPTPPFNRPTVSPPRVSDNPFATRADAGTSKGSTTPTSGAPAQTSNEENRPSLFSWSGRATQREFLGAVGYYLLYSLLLGIVLGVLFALLGALSQADSDALRVVAGLGTLVVGLAGAAGSVAVQIILLAASARRLRDAGLSPYLTLLHFVVPLPLTIFLAVYPGQTGQTDARPSEPRSQTPQAQQPPQPTATQNASSPAATPTPTPTPSTATLGWRRFFSWNAPARPTDLPLALGLYALTAVWLVAHLFFDVFIDNATVEYFYDRDWLDRDAVFGPVALNFIRLVLLFGKLAIFTLNLTAIGVSILTLVKGTRK
ncbi:MAG: DUF805 domain-containing protein [Thermoguttaceae bacterium]|nr:DUF805 domain-containing protein [Thermoguttaceae bacterium]MBQ7111010.1 DUF805 domain-containing protein [Thermoguttaceae bacterium]